MKTHLLAFLLLLGLFACKQDPPQTVDEHINAGASIAELRDLFPDDSLYGKEYHGGIIFFFTANNEAYLISKTDLNAGTNWGCFGVDIAGANSIAFGDGTANTDAIVQVCTDHANAAGSCFHSIQDNQSDWYLPTYRELEEVHNALHLSGIKPFESELKLWSSTQLDAQHAYYFDFESGIIKDTAKSAYLPTRGIRWTP